MPVSSGIKGTGKKNANAIPKQSRTSTPVPVPTSSLPAQEPYDPDFLNTRVILFKTSLVYEDVVDQNSSNAAVPDSRSVDAMLAKLRDLSSIMEKRSNFYDRGMRFLADERKRRPDDYPLDEEGKRPKHKRKKASDNLAPPPDGSHARSSPNPKRKHSRDVSFSSSLSPAAAPPSPSAMEVDEKAAKEEDKEADDESSSDDDSAPPRREMPQSQTFGEDPSTFPDPTVYEIRQVHPKMTEDQKKEIYSVVSYPHSDLADLIAGVPPDRDFSSAKPTNQINYSTFLTYTEPFFRPFGEEDLAFLRERGDRVTPFVLPARGKRHYSEIWSEEDGAMSIDSSDDIMAKLLPNQPRGTIENMNDAVGETDALSIPPILSRLMAAMRPEHRPPPSEDKPATNGDVVMGGDSNGAEEQIPAGTDDKNVPVPPATYMPESSTEAWKKATHPKLEYPQAEERLKQELRHIGFLPVDGPDGDFDGAYDDEVSARLRLLQKRLKEQILMNGARKAKLTELVKERMAHQEYSTILEDLDGQVQSAFTKRTRTMGKSKKTKRPGGAGGGSHAVGSIAAGTARPGIGDQTKTLMERRKRWINTIGSVFTDEMVGKVPRSEDPNSSIFKEKEMKELIQKEKDLWDEEVDDE